MDCNKRLHVKVELCTVNLFIVFQTGLNRNKSIYLSVWIQSWHVYAAVPCTEHQKDWSIHSLYHIHLFTHIHILNSVMKYYSLFFFTLEKYRTLMIGPLWLCFSWGILHPFDKSRNMLFFILHRHLWRTRFTKVQDQCAKTRDLKELEWKGQ